MSTVQVVAFLCIVIPVFLLVDIKLAFDKTPGNTYSEIIRDTGNRHPWFRILFLVSVGVLLGHWFWSVAFLAFPVYPQNGIC